MYTISDIKRINKEKGYYFFSPDTMLFFRSKAYSTIYEGEGGIYFLTSEQFIDSSGVESGMMFTVRSFCPNTGNIKTVGDFNVLSFDNARNKAKSLCGG